jgi:polyketide biosynthesis acyl carrier protein
MREEIFEKIVTYINDIIGEVGIIKEEDSLKDLGANSIDRAEIIIGVIRELELRINLMEFGNCRNIAGIINVIMLEMEKKV